MLNIEKYRNEMVKTGLNIAKKKGKLCSCDGTRCKDCDFHVGKIESCRKNKLDWLCSEYIEKPMLTDREWYFCIAMQTGWIARDKNGEMFLYFDRPTRGECKWHSYYDCNAVPKMITFDFIRWEEDEPWAVEDLLKLEVRKEEEE